MFGKSRKAQQAIERGNEAEAKKSRFQIVKLEERIAPSPGVCYDHGRRGCPGHGGGGHGRH
jgi:hypothetical protein